MSSPTRNLLAAALLRGLLLMPALAQTNRFFITDESQAPYKEEPFSPEEVERARTALDSRPADEDPEGHWGPVAEGFQLSLRLEKESFTNGEPVTARLLLRNVSTNELRYPVAFGNKDIETTLILMRGEERVRPREELESGAPFNEQLKRVFRGTESFWPSRPGTQRRFLFDLGKLFDLSGNGEYTVRAKRKIPKTGQDAVEEVTSGTAAFRIVAGTEPSQK
jgi:hypothetical protein